MYSSKVIMQLFTIQYNKTMIHFVDAYPNCRRLETIYAFTHISYKLWSYNKY